MDTLTLSQSTLHRYGPRVAVPSYDRRALVPSVVHLSVGSFHRSHQAVYFDDLAMRGHTAWGITGVGLRRRDMADALVPQHGLFTVVERRARGDRPRIIGVMRRYLLVPEDPLGVVAALAAQRTRLVTLTVTGEAYHVDPATGAFDADAPELVADLASPASPRSALGLLVEALDRRRRAGHPPFTVLSCDNMPGNGEVTRRAVVGFAQLRDERLARWIDEHGAFPSSMVDRITPMTTDADRARLARDFGVVDRSPVMTEPFSAWVIEDRFCNGRPPLEEVGVRFTDDVRPYALVKTRLLNALHLVLGAVGGLAGMSTMGEVMRDPVLRAYADALTRQEIVPALPDADMDLEAYRRSVLDRLANPKMEDQLARLCRASSQKLPRHVLPSLLAARAEHRPHPLLTLAVAALCRLHRGADERGRRFDIDDDAGPRLRALALVGGDDPRALLSDHAVFGDLGDDDAFVAELASMMARLDRDGVRRTVARSLAPGESLIA